MTNILEIKPYIYNFVQENLDPIFAQKIYWIGERRNVPQYPYCTLNIIAENKDKRTSTHDGKLIDEIGREQITTLYKTATITISIYNAWVTNSYDSVPMKDANEFAYEQINVIEEAFETRFFQELFYPFFTVQSISPIRPLPETVDGGYMYRYEFDLTIGYNEISTRVGDIGEEVEVRLNTDGKNKIWFEVDSETGQINNLV